MRWDRFLWVLRSTDITSSYSSLAVKVVFVDIYSSLNFGTKGNSGIQLRNWNLWVGFNRFLSRFFCPKFNVWDNVINAQLPAGTMRTSIAWMVYSFLCSWCTKIAWKLGLKVLLRTILPKIFVSQILLLSCVLFYVAHLWITFFRINLKWI